MLTLDIKHNNIFEFSKFGFHDQKSFLSEYLRTNCKSSRGLAVKNSTQTNVVLSSRPTASHSWRQEGYPALNAHARTKVLSEAPSKPQGIGETEVKTVLAKQKYKSFSVSSQTDYCKIIQCIEILKSCLNLNIDKVIANIKILKKHRASGDGTQEIMICMLHGYAIWSIESLEE